MILLRKLLREPLAHFLVLGALVFTMFQFAADRSDLQDGKIVVTRGKIEQLVTGFSRTWNRPPTRPELDGLVEDYIRDEVLYREALAMGLDKDDTIVRRRMRQKLEFLTERCERNRSAHRAGLAALAQPESGPVPRRARHRVFPDLLQFRPRG